MNQLNNCNLEPLNREQQINIHGGSKIAFLTLAISMLYKEVNDIWESGGENLKKAWREGYDAGYGN